MAAPLSASAGPYSLPGYAYVSPAPGTHYHKSNTNIIIRPGGLIDPTSLSDGGTVRVTADFSGDHPGRIRLSDDGRTIVFHPTDSFFSVEGVACHVTGIRTLDGLQVPDGDFQFATGGTGEKLLATTTLISPEAATGIAPDLTTSLATTDTSASDSIPVLTGAVYGLPAPGRLFLSDILVTDFGHPSNLLVARDNGSIVDARRTARAAYGYTLQPDGRRTYYDIAAGAFYALDDSGAVVDSFRCGNGYATDGHELLLRPDGHVFLMAYDTQRIDMSQIVPGGQLHAQVMGLVIQELDRERDVVYQWRSWESVGITEAMRVPLTAQAIDYVHGNSIDLTPDGGAMLVSCRHLDAVLKVSLETGDIVWRLGGAKNQFEFVGDPDRFTYQHDARMLPDGHLTLFDDGNGHSPPYSRAVEYELDESAMTATLVWQYRHTPSVFAFALGSVQRLPNGNTLIGWGAASPAATEVAPDGTVMSELWLPAGLVSYRVRRFEWPPALPVTVTPQPATYSSDAQGRWATLVVEPETFDVDRIDPSTVRLQGSLAPDPASAVIGDSNGDNRPDIRLRFDMDALQATLHIGVNRIEVEGPLIGGGLFRGYALVTLLDSKKADAAAANGSFGLAAGAVGSRVALGALGRAGGSAGLAIFDVQGRLVRHWRPAVDGGAATWDGRGDDGRRLPSGVYFVRELSPAPGARPAPGRKVILAR